jgi:hypothetical protein
MAESFFGHTFPVTLDQSFIISRDEISVTGDLMDCLGFRGFIAVILQFQIPKERFQNDSGTFLPRLRFHDDTIKKPTEIVKPQSV